MHHADLRRKATAVIATPAPALLYDTCGCYGVWVCVWWDERCDGLKKHVIFFSTTHRQRSGRGCYVCVVRLGSTVNQQTLETSHGDLEDKSMIVRTPRTL